MTNRICTVEETRIHKGLNEVVGCAKSCVADLTKECWASSGPSASRNYRVDSRLCRQSDEVEESWASCKQWPDLQVGVTEWTLGNEMK